MVKAVETNTPQTEGGPSTEELQAQVALLKADIARLTETLGDYGRHKTREVQDEAVRRAEDLKADAQAKYDDVEAYVRKNPAQALGIAAGVGLLIGMFSRR